MKYILLVVMISMAPVAHSNEVSDFLKAETKQERRRIFGEVIHQSEKACGKVTKTFFQGRDRDDAAYWSVACSGGNSYSVQIPADSNASARVLECSLLEALGIKCFKKLQD